jgi:hypothetical protein
MKGVVMDITLLKQRHIAAAAAIAPEIGGVDEPGPSGV